MKKKLIVINFFICSFFLIGIFKVEAKECAYGLQAPAIPQSYASVTGPVHRLYTSENTCKGVNTEVWFSNFGTLPNWYVPNTGTIIHAYLKEKDSAGNDPEIVKYYVGFFEGRVLTDFALQKTITSGNIEAEGDQGCELYMDFSISRTSADPTGLRVIPDKLFYYTMCMN